MIFAFIVKNLILKNLTENTLGAFPKLLMTALKVTVPLTAISFTLGIMIALLTALVQIAKIPVLRQLAQHGSVLRQCGVADEELDEEGLVLPRLRVLRGDRVPPPVVAVVRQRPVQHEFVPCDIVRVDHFSSVYAAES